MIDNPIHSARSLAQRLSTYTKQLELRARAGQRPTPWHLNATIEMAEQLLRHLREIEPATVNGLVTPASQIKTPPH